MNLRLAPLAGIASPIIFTITYLLMSSQRDDYDMFTKAVSELGSLDAPNKWWWNLFGYIIPGLLIVIFSKGLLAQLDPQGKNRLAIIGMAGSGAGMLMSGLFPGDFEDRSSTTMVLHAIGSISSYLCFLLGAFRLPRSLRLAGNGWNTSIKPFLATTWATIIFGTWPYIFPSMPGIGQRLVFFFYFLSIWILAIKLVRSQESENPERI